MEIATSHYSEDNLAGTRYSMIDDGEEVGYLIAHTTGLVLNVEVDDDTQGLYHIPAWGRTGDGNRFANAMGGDTMDDEQAAAIVGMDLSIYDVD